MYKKAVAGIRKHLIQRRNGRFFLVNRKGDQVMEEQEHLACFMPGLLALGAHEDNDAELLELAGQLTESCYMMYRKQRVGLSPEFININTMRPTLHRTYWSMRPETIESIFVLWRITKDPKYRRWGYEIALAIEKYAKVDGGYAGIENILSSPFQRIDRQESYFLAETLKYLYLLFGPNDVLPLDQWVFNTEAHPFPINWRGKAYSQGSKPEQKSPVSGTLVMESQPEEPKPKRRTAGEKKVPAKEDVIDQVNAVDLEEEEKTPRRPPGMGKKVAEEDGDNVKASRNNNSHKDEAIRVADEDAEVPNIEVKGPTTKENIAKMSFKQSVEEADVPIRKPRKIVKDETNEPTSRSAVKKARKQVEEIDTKDGRLSLAEQLDPPMRPQIIEDKYE
ncbi:alpha-1,2-Mannosidase [Paramicrosporidium saccamoebae]|uniref:alpha-1,2-Mannosidase n=1 Tax=Paramicrosporidium saccamoebae TaxID=1246581 RepID=A0A2H9TMG0_9FUNG|nr:alpha-1,2-Mannosidase [Paramicrosporidium saccamoebae]